MQERKGKMELKIKEYQLPENIVFNYEELKKELQEKISVYETLVYGDDQIKLAKADKANLNKLKKALNDERIRREKEYMVPFNDFKAKINEIIYIIDKPVAAIDKQVKEYEDKKKQDKLDAITDFFNSTDHPEWLHFSQILDDKWLNASVSMKNVQDSICAWLDRIKVDLATLSNLPEFGFEATEVYKYTLDINRALNEGHRLSEIAKKKAEHEAEQERLKAATEAKSMNPAVPETNQNEETNTGIIEPAKEWVSFKCLLTVEDAQALGQFFRSRNIQYEQI